MSTVAGAAAGTGTAAASVVAASDKSSTEVSKHSSRGKGFHCNNVSEDASLCEILQEKKK